MPNTVNERAELRATVETLAPFAPIVLLQRGLSEEVRGWVAAARRSKTARSELCFESEDFSVKDSVSLIRSTLERSGVQMFAVAVGRPQAIEVAVSTKEGVCLALERLLAKHLVVGIWDMTRAGGLSCDQSEDEDCQANFNLAAWGSMQPLLRDAVAGFDGYLYEPA